MAHFHDFLKNLSWWLMRRDLLSRLENSIVLKSRNDLVTPHIVEKNAK